MEIAVIMPVIAAIGSVIIVTVLLIGRNMVKKEQIKRADGVKFKHFAEDVKKQHAEMRKELQSIKEKVEAIDTMMKDI